MTNSKKYNKEDKMMIYDNPDYNVWIIDGKKVRLF